MPPTPTSTRSPGRGKAKRPPARVLPAAGRKGRAPAWPLEGKAPKQWARVWKAPQAVVWEEMRLHAVVARYALLLAVVEHRWDSEEGTPITASALSNAWSEVRQMEDRLGLSPLAMMRMEWEVREDEAAAPQASGSSTAEVTQLDRWRSVAGA